MLRGFLVFVSILLAAFAGVKYMCQKSKNVPAAERLMAEAPVIVLKKINEFFDPEQLNAAQGIRSVFPDEDAPEGELAVSSGYLNGADRYSLDLKPLHQRTFLRPEGDKTLMADVMKLQNGQYLYSDFKGHRLVFMGKDGAFVKFSDPALQLQYPIGMDQFSDGTIFLVDYGNDRLVLLSEEGTLLKETKTLGEISLKVPYDVRILNDTAYVVDRLHHRIYAVDQAFNLLRTYDTLEDGKALFHSPQHIDFDSKGRLYVMDTGSKSIKVLNIKTGALIAQLTHPDIHIFRGLTIDHNDRVYIAGFKTGYPKPPTPMAETHAGIIVFDSVDF